MPSITNFAGLPALAALSLLATPAAAAERPVPAPGRAAAAMPAPLWTPADETAANHRRYRYRRGSDAGDIITGVLIVGGIAAIANAAARRDREERYRDRDYRYPDARTDQDDWRYRDDRRDAYDDSRGLDRAVQMCIDAVERDARVESVTSADRTAAGWTVSGALAGGQGWSCSIGADGRIERIDTNGAAVPYRGADSADGDAGYAPSGTDRQWDDDRYAAERARVEGADGAEPYAEAEADVAQGPQPAYPGGPLPGEEGEPQGAVEEGTGYPGAGA